MIVARRLATALAAGLWFTLAMPIWGQDVVPDDANLQSVARVLEAATNLPQILLRPPLPEGEAGLREAVETERLRLIQILKDDGYLGAEIALEWPGSAVEDTSTMRVRVDPGSRYSLGAVTVATMSPIADEVMERLQSTVEMAVGDIATAAVIDNLSSRLTWTLGQSGYPFARVHNIDFELEPERQSAKLAVGIDTGGLSRFVDVDFAEVDRGLRSRIAPLIPFAAGDLYSVETLVALREELAGLSGIDRTRAEVVPAGDDGFILSLQAERAPELSSGTLASILGLGLLLATLGALAARQVAVFAGARKSAVQLFSVATGGLFLTSCCLLALRAFSFL
jgi:outer membrane translocation and assembly module TamA